MSKVGPEGRSYARITRADLHHLARIAAADRREFFSAHPDWASLYKSRFLCSALCQGAALHYVNGSVGVNGFDVYWFLTAHPSRRWYAKRRKRYDFGAAKFGRSVDRPDFVGRRVDVMARALQERPGSAEPATALRHYLTAGRTKTARLLAAKAIVLLEPERLLGTVVWPHGGNAAV